jgi:hypothetical protein
MALATEAQRNLLRRLTVPENVGQGYPKNEIFTVAVIEDPPITLDPAEQKPPRFILKPEPFLAPSPQIALVLAARSPNFAHDADLQRCRVQITNG